MITMRMPWASPPLRSNNRLHWAAKADTVRGIRKDAAAIIGRQPRPISSPVTITIVWEVTDHRRRDVGASAPTLKAAIDGLVDAGLLPLGDHAAIVTEERYRIEHGTRRGVRIEIEATR